MFESLQSDEIENMKVTAEVLLVKNENHEEKNPKLMAWASINFDDAFVVYGIKVIEKKNGELTIVFPSRKTVDNHRISTAYPITQDSRESLKDLIIKTYKEALK